jgi:hypothetical protein
MNCFDYDGVGGTAFPTATYNGVSVRDYFAKEAMSYALGISPSYKAAATVAYQIADAMLVARGIPPATAVPSAV